MHTEETGCVPGTGLSAGAPALFARSFKTSLGRSVKEGMTV